MYRQLDTRRTGGPRYARTVRRVFAVVLLCVAPVCAEDVPPASQVLNVAPASFAPSSDGARYALEEGGFGRLCPAKGAGYFVAPLRVENGAVIERVSAYVQDESKKSFALMSLIRHTPEKAEVLAVTGVSRGAQDIETLTSETITSPIIDDQHYSYLLQVVLSGPGVCLRGAQVTYRTP